MCKQRAPFQLSDDFFTEPGLCGPKRLYRCVNAWSPPILLNVRCNNGIEFLTNSGDAKNIMSYITPYATKKQGKNHNMSAIMGRAISTIQSLHMLTTSKINAGYSSIFRLVHTINYEKN